VNTLVGILNIGMGNLRSVSNAFDYQGFDFTLLNSSEQLMDVSHLVLPGVGSFGTAAARLSEGGFFDGVRRFADSGRPVLGLCLGMQLLAEEGTEGRESEGLGLIPARVRSMRLEEFPVIPHVGWNSVELSRMHPIFEGVKTGRDYYFVHSFVVEPFEKCDVLGVTEHGAPFASAMGRDNVIGLQFHPEKSQANGLKLLENFAQWDGVC
jgi:imidazole glycerol-phosphate synthase subunit HisH